jgi:hypothetical protein
MKKEYCTQNNGDCQTCSLVNYGRDCRNNPADPQTSILIRLPGSLKERLSAAAAKLEQQHPGSRYTMQGLALVAIEEKVEQVEQVEQQQK